MDKMTIKADDGKEFNYSIDTDPNMLGYSIATCPITEEINSDLKLIRKGDITEKEFTKKELKDLYYCNLGIEDLIGKYYDKDGFIYYDGDSEIYRFYLKIKYFAKLYKKNNQLLKAKE
jgi:hypothetical protein